MKDHDGGEGESAPRFGEGRRLSSGDCEMWEEMVQEYPHTEGCAPAEKAEGGEVVPEEGLAWAQA